MRVSLINAYDQFNEILTICGKITKFQTCALHASFAKMKEKDNHMLRKLKFATSIQNLLFIEP